MQKDVRLVVALDGLDLRASLDLVSAIQDGVDCYKIHDLWDREGPGVVNTLKKAGALWVWVDLKLHYIPNTVALRAKAVRDARADILTVHASGGVAMMTAAVENGPEMILAVTILTSLYEEWVHLTYGNPARASALQFAIWAKAAGVHGIVCSPQEVGFLAKQQELKGLRFVVPGTRSPGADVADQKRVDTQANAVRAGANILVIGREIISSDNPRAAAQRIAVDIAEALKTQAA